MHAGTAIAVPRNVKLEAYRIKKWIALCLCATAMTVACGRRAETPPPEKPTDTNDYSKNNQTRVEIAKTVTGERDLQGRTFISDCFTQAVEGHAPSLLTGWAPLRSSQSSYSVSGHEIKHMIKIYDNSDCQGDPAFVFDEVGEITFEDSEKTSEATTPVMVSYKTLNGKPGNLYGAWIANSKSLCGHEDWATAYSLDVTAKAYDQECYAAPVPREIRTSYRLDGNVLSWGAVTQDRLQKQVRYYLQ